jgi:hypothetical protein
MLQQRRTRSPVLLSVCAGPQAAGEGGEVPDVEALAPILRGRWQQLADKAGYQAQALAQLERFRVSAAAPVATTSG